MVCRMLTMQVPVPWWDTLLIVPPTTRTFYWNHPKRAIWKTVTNHMSFVEGREISLNYAIKHFISIILCYKSHLSRSWGRPGARTEEIFFLAPPSFSRVTNTYPTFNGSLSNHLGCFSFAIVSNASSSKKIWRPPSYVPAMLKSESSSHHWQQRWSHLVCCHL
jgi:hypothetical protein